MDKQGQNANQSGKEREKHIRIAMEQRGVEVKTWGKYKKLKDKSGEFWITNPPYKSIFEHDGESDGLYIKDSVHLLRLEQKNQNVAGSVDEKIPCMIENLREGKFPEPHMVFVIEGNGYKDGVVPWFEGKIDEYNKKIGMQQEAHFFRDADSFLEMFDEFRN